MSTPAPSSRQAGNVFPQLGTPFVEPDSGLISRPWQRLLIGLFKRSGGSVSPLGVSAYVGLDDAGDLYAYRADDNTVIGRIEVGSSDGPSAPQVLTLGASPASYTAPGTGTLVVESGQVELSRSGSKIVAGLAGGAVPMQKGDVAVITYARVVPQAKFFGD